MVLVARELSKHLTFAAHQAEGGSGRKGKAKYSYQRAEMACNALYH